MTIKGEKLKCNYYEAMPCEEENISYSDWCVLYNKKCEEVKNCEVVKEIKMNNQPKKRGRKPGKFGKYKPLTINFHRRVTPEEYKTLDIFLKNMRNLKNEKNKKKQ